MENAFIFDLATTRNPRSAFTYVNYLLAQDRLVEFANSDRLNPLREEFEDYLRWCASQFTEQVRYHSEVVGVVPEKNTGSVRGWNVAVKNSDGSTYTVRSKNIVAPSPSTTKNDPRPQNLTSVDFEAGQRIMSMKDYASRRNELRGFHEPRINIALVGSGDDTVEILDDLLSCHRLGNITVVTENEALAPLRILADEPSPPQPRLCSIWAKPSCEAKSTVTGSSELIQSIYMRAYEKQLKGEFALRVIMGSDAAGPISEAGVIITDRPSTQLSSSALFHGLDSLVLGCRQKGDSLEEVQFKRGAVAEGCRMWLQSANSEGGRSLAKDIALRAGEVVKGVADGSRGTQSAADGSLLINARI